MSKNNQQLFTFGNSQVRTVLDDTGEVWFVAKDVATALGYKNPNEAINTHCEEGVAKCYPLQTAGGTQEVRVIDESDLYALIFGSKLEAAKRFKVWVTKEVLPTIRKTGSYTRNALIDTKYNVVNSYYLAMTLGCKMSYEGVRQEAERITAYFGDKYVSGVYPDGLMVTGYGKVHELPWNEALEYLNKRFEERLSLSNASYSGSPSNQDCSVKSNQGRSNNQDCSMTLSAFDDALKAIQSAFEVIERFPESKPHIDKLLSQLGV